MFCRPITARNKWRLRDREFVQIRDFGRNFLDRTPTLIYPIRNVAFVGFTDFQSRGSDSTWECRELSRELSQIYTIVSGRESVTVSPLTIWNAYIHIYAHIIHVTHNPWFMLHPRVHRYLLHLYDNLIVRLRFQSDVIFAKFDLLLAPYASAFRIKRINYYHSFEQSSNTYATWTISYRVYLNDSTWSALYVYKFAYL